MRARPITAWHTAAAVLAGSVALAACSGGDDSASVTAPAPATLDVAASTAGSTASAATRPPPTTVAPSTTVAPPPATTAPSPTVPPTTMPPTTVPPPPTAPPTEPPPPPPAPCAVVAVGDSVGQDMFNNEFGASLANVGCHLAAATGRAASRCRRAPATSPAARDIPANVVVVVLGYHNAVSQTRSGTFPALIDGVMEAAGDRTVVWSLPGRTSDCGASFTNAVAVEGQLVLEATGRWPNLVPVDYASVIDAHPEYSQNRCPHLVNSGSRAVGAWLADEVRRIVDTSG